MKIALLVSITFASIVAPAWGYRSRSRGYGMRDDFDTVVIKKPYVPPEPSHKPPTDIVPVIVTEKTPPGPPEIKPKTPYAEQICDGKQGPKLKNCLGVANQLKGAGDTSAHYVVQNVPTETGTKVNQFWVIDGKFGCDDCRRRRLRGRKLFHRVTFQDKEEQATVLVDESKASFHLVFGTCQCEPDFEHSLAIVCPNTEQCKKEVELHNFV